MELYVSKAGNDAHDGSVHTPFLTIERAKNEIKKISGKENIIVKIIEGIYYLKKPLIFRSEDGCTNKEIIYEGIGKVILSGGVPLELEWKPYRDGIYMAKIEKGICFDQFFVNGERQIMARYPTYDPSAKYYNGYAADSFQKERIAHYKNPKGGFMYAMHEGLWGDFQYEITGKNEKGELKYKGGHQNNRPSNMHKTIRYIEHIFEELDTEKEWFLDKEASILYYKPEISFDLENSICEGVVLRNIVSFIGTKEEAVQNITFKNIEFAHAKRTFMEKMEPLLRSDWCVYRGGAIFVKGAEQIKIINCIMNQLGGNAVFVSGYNKNIEISGCYIYDAGGSSVLFIGEPKAVRSPLFSYDDEREVGESIDLEKGPKGYEFPHQCVVEDNLLIRNGRFEKQTAGVCISMSKNITVSNNTIYDVPRAGINICDGVLGGHLIAYNEVFDTVKETSDHGAFNSWGRDRFWNADYEKMEEDLKNNSELPYLDAVEPTVIKNNCFQCAHGWDIDLDDGSSNYRIYNNLCLKGGIKNREGFKRIVYNNILLNNTYHPHVWFENSKDQFFKNIIFKNYADIGLKQWGDVFDFNILHKKDQSGGAIELQEKSHMDINSIYEKIEFTNSKQGDFTVLMTDGIKETGFENFETSQMGVRTKKLKDLAISPYAEEFVIENQIERDGFVHEFHGMEVKNLLGLGEISATGMYEERGIYVKNIEESSIWYEKGIRTNDVILSIGGVETSEVDAFIESMDAKEKELVIWRNQGKHVIDI